MTKDQWIGWLLILAIIFGTGGGLAWFFFRKGRTWDDER